MEAPKNHERDRSFPARKQIQELVVRWSRMKNLLNQRRSETGEARDQDSFLEKVQKGIKETGLDYISVIQRMPPSDSVIGTQWLQGIVDRVVNETLNLIPSFR
jgi:hypothetical protein